jgi:hypothetical protein
LALPFGPGEKELADKAEANRQALIKEGLQPAIKALTDKNQDEIRRLMLGEITRLFRLYIEGNEKLTAYQLESTGQHWYRQPGRLFA